MDVASNLQNMIFPVYDNLEKQNYNKKWCHGNNSTAPLYTPYNKLLPFQILRGANGKIVTDLSWTATDINTGNIIDLMALLPVGYTTLYQRTTGILDWIIYDATQSFFPFLPQGQYYFTMSDTINTWYSEIFTIHCFIDPLDCGEDLDIGDGGGVIIITDPVAGVDDDKLIIGGLDDVLF